MRRVVLPRIHEGRLQRVAAGALALILFAALGCRSIGPQTVPRDRFDYSSALANSWKQQMLLNLVKTRYLDLPIYLEVGQIVSGYSLETGVTLSGQLAKTGAGDQFVGAEASGRFTDRPTITYTPLTGEEFLQNFLSPIHPGKVFALVESGYPADFILELSLEYFNGLRNSPVGMGSQRKADPEFFRALKLFREIQDGGAVGLRMERHTNGQPSTVLLLRHENLSPEIQAKTVELRELLGIAQQHSEYRLVQSPLRGHSGNLGVGTRSLMQVLIALSKAVQIPPAHQKRNLAPPLPDEELGETPLLRVQSGSNRPPDAFAAVTYEGEWFWVANDDWMSKRTFIAILFIFTLADASGSEKLPTITIPAQ